MAVRMWGGLGRAVFVLVGAPGVVLLALTAVSAGLVSGALSLMLFGAVRAWTSGEKPQDTASTGASAPH